MKVLFLTNIPSPYRVAFFNALGKLCELTVLFEKANSKERDKSWQDYQAQNFTAILLKGKHYGVANAFCPGVVKYLKKGKFDHVIVSNFSSATGMLAIRWMRMKGIPYWLESDGGFAKEGKGFKERLKRHFIKGAAGYFSTAREHDQYYLHYGAKEEALYRYPFSSVLEKDILAAPVSAGEKQALREKLDIPEKQMIVAVGQMIPRKGFDVLLEAMTLVAPEVGCYIIGGTPTEEFLAFIKEHKLENVHFVGFLQKAQLSEYYMAADAFVLPTREDIWGLVVNEAMAKGLPVVTTNRCIAGLELVKPGMGQIVPVGDKAALAAAIRDTLAQASEACSQRILEHIRAYTVENMACRHMEVLTGPEQKD